MVSLSMPERIEKFDDFLSFCRECGVDTSSVSVVRKDAQNYGLRANRELEEYELILSIPRKLILSAERIPDDDVFREFASQDPLLKEMPNLLLVMILIREFCDTNSFWKPYIDILPSSYETPLFWDLDTLFILKHSCNTAFEEAAKILRNIGRQYAYFWTQMDSGTGPASRLSFKKTFCFELYR